MGGDFAACPAGASTSRSSSIRRAGMAGRVTGEQRLSVTWRCTATAGGRLLRHGTHCRQGAACHHALCCSGALVHTACGGPHNALVQPMLLTCKHLCRQRLSSGQKHSPGRLCCPSRSCCPLSATTRLQCSFSHHPGLSGVPEACAGHHCMLRAHLLSSIAPPAIFSILAYFLMSISRWPSPTS